MGRPLGHVEDPAGANLDRDDDRVHLISLLPVDSPICYSLQLGSYRVHIDSDHVQCQVVLHDVERIKTD